MYDKLLLAIGPFRALSLSGALAASGELFDWTVGVDKVFTTGGSTSVARTSALGPDVGLR